MKHVAGSGQGWISEASTTTVVGRRDTFVEEHPIVLSPNSSNVDSITMLDRSREIGELAIGLVSEDFGI